MTARRVGTVAGLVAVLLMTACAGPLPSPVSTTPATSAPRTATPTAPSNAAAQLSVTGTGSIACMIPHGCLPSFLVQPEDWDPAPDWEPQPDDPYFEVTLDGGQRIVSGEAIGAPSTLAPGRYRLAIAVSERSDVGSMAPDGSIVFAFMWTEVECTHDLAVETDTERIDVEVFFGNPCRIDVRLDPER